MTAQTASAFGPVSDPGTACAEPNRGWRYRVYARLFMDPDRGWYKPSGWRRGG